MLRVNHARRSEGARIEGTRRRKDISCDCTKSGEGFLELERDRAATLFVSHDGYMPRQVFLDPSKDPAALWPFAGNILIGGIIGMSVDTRSGALYHLTPYPEPSVERLEPETRWLLRLEEAELDESAEPLDQLSEESDVEDSD